MIPCLTFWIVVTAGGTQMSVRGIEGTVRDIFGGLLPGAQVTATALEHEMKPVTTVSGSDGSFSIPNLPVGKYRVTVQLPGLLTQSQEPITVRDAHVFSRVSFVLTLPPPEPVTVGGDPFERWNLVEKSSFIPYLLPVPRGRTLADFLRSLQRR